MADDDDFDDLGETKVVKLIKNGSRKDLKDIHISSSWSISQLLRAASTATHLSIKRIFHADGLELDSVNMIANNECLVVSAGEDFEYPRQRRSRSQKDLGAGTTVAGYKIGKVLGKGGFGVVRMGHKAVTEEEVALKFLSRSGFTNTHDAERVMTEIACLMDLDHPNIIRLRDVHDTPEYMVIALDYAPGGDLEGFLDRKGGRLDEDTARTIFAQIVRGVQYAHNRGIVHRDLKLENVLLNAKNECVISDFGLSQYASGDELTVATGGSLFYFAPESFTGLPTSGQAVDVWCMGIMLYRLLVGKFPFFSETLEETMQDIMRKQSTEGHHAERAALTKACHLVDRKIVTQEIRRAICKTHPLYPPDLSKPVQDLIQRLLAKKPEARLSIAEICVHPWMMEDHVLTEPRSATKSSSASAMSVEPVSEVLSPPRSVERSKSLNDAPEVACSVPEAIAITPLSGGGSDRPGSSFADGHADALLQRNGSEGHFNAGGRTLSRLQTPQSLDVRGWGFGEEPEPADAWVASAHTSPKLTGGTPLKQSTPRFVRGTVPLLYKRTSTPSSGGKLSGPLMISPSESPMITSPIMPPITLSPSVAGTGAPTSASSTSFKQMELLPGRSDGSDDGIRTPASGQRRGPPPRIPTRPDSMQATPSPGRDQLPPLPTLSPTVSPLVLPDFSPKGVLRFAGGKPVRLASLPSLKSESTLLRTPTVESVPRE